MPITSISTSIITITNTNISTTIITIVITSTSAKTAFSSDYV